MAGFVGMLGFDAIVGNNDRHYFNWGVITDLKGRRPPRFSPIYDTARALFWDGREDKLAQVVQHKRFEQHITRYVDDSMPKTGWPGIGSVNHFQLIQLIAAKRPAFRALLEDLGSIDIVAKTESLLGTEFAGLFSERRQNFVLHCLNMRHQRFVDALGA